MKKALLLLLLFGVYQSYSQTYPYAEGFEGMPNTQVPTGWGGSMKVLQNHGLNDFKAISARVSSAVPVDSGITPLIGPLTSASAFSFYYRIINQANYPSTPKDMDNGDMVEIMISTDGVNYQTVYQIDMNNHNPTFNFAKRKVFLSQYAGSTVNFKLRCTYATTPSFFVDFDTITVMNDPQAGIEDATAEQTFTLFPNPVSAGNNCFIQTSIPTNQPVKIYNALGEVVYNTQTFADCTLPTADYTPGLYFLQCGNTTRKLIITQ